ncbi:hypothetical protein DICSQDRAFT_161253 [Dichomitus squalens LYAD-421 SS1]|uniref:Actin-like ATPase domain-containing protein n=1 Tax=Dichomitus squalens (strain LYAD-421) TaxID=732165 RepID=R7T1V4_DICSQ|nr:uncharacterized protein DICSQDRAFT_161253 [Dichomitus squalens LYAD-421 SS1]EJF61940.1 hypothetical protein DICSQDRAFT_161253 [Dichomitus squalens LYAD-421 SS1]
MPSLQPYSGTVRKLVLGIDIGTTYSGIAYALLDPGEVPKIHGVTRFPGQENAAGDSKIPSILYYRQDGSVHSAGAEAALPGMDLEAEDQELVLVEWFKLHLRPERLDSGDFRRQDLPPLPRGKSVIDVFSDFLGYLFRCASQYIRETHANGESLWTSIEDRIEFVLSHPNGWEGLQQGRMRQAAITAGLVPDTAAGHARVHFVTEGEASLNFCIQSGLTEETMQDGKTVMIIDAGGGTVDISTYTFVSISPVSVEEITSADCILQGSTRINLRAEKFLKERLASSAYGNDEDIKSMMDYFDKSTKPVFKDHKESSYIKFGSMSCNDAKHKIRRGQLMLSGAEMSSFFQPSLDAIVDVVQKQRREVASPLETVFLVGGFAASPWLHTALKSALDAHGVTLCRPDSHTSKAVANGAVCFYLEQFVSARIMKMTYGTGVAVDYDPNDPEHHRRRDSLFIRPSGRVMIRNGFSTILKKGTRMRESEEISQPYNIEARNVRTLDSIVSDVLCYRGRSAQPKWVDVEPEFYTPLCTVYADTSRVKKVAHNGPEGLYYLQEFKVVLLCGLTELQAQISWVDGGVERRGPAKIVYDDDLEVSH